MNILLKINNFIISKPFYINIDDGINYRINCTKIFFEQLFCTHKWNYFSPMSGYSCSPYCIKCLKEKHK